MIKFTKGQQIFVGANFDEKVYIKFDSVLRAARLIRVDFFKDWKCYCTFKVAGLGTVEEPDEGSFKTYNSVDDFRNDRPICKLNPTGGMEFSSADVLDAAFDGIATPYRGYNYEGYQTSMVRYKWNGVACETVEMGYGDLWMDKNGFHVEHKIPAGTYLTKEECEADNMISVVEFDD